MAIIALPAYLVALGAAVASNHPPHGALRVGQPHFAANRLDEALRSDSMAVGKR